MQLPVFPAQWMMSKQIWLQLKRNGVAFSSVRKGPTSGGGPPPEETRYVKHVLNIMGEKSAILAGIEGGHVFVLSGVSIICRFFIFTVLLLV